MKIFEKREYTDGGTNDRGYTIGYVKTNKTKEQLRKEVGHGFIDFIELSEKQFLEKKEEAFKKYKMFDL
jgi:hypothetical protein